MTVIRENRRNDVVAGLRNRVVEAATKDRPAVVNTVKNLKAKHLPLDLRPKRTRALRRRLTRFEAKLVTLRQLKRRLNFPRRRFAVPLH